MEMIPGPLPGKKGVPTVNLSSMLPLHKRSVTGLLPGRKSAPHINSVKELPVYQFLSKLKDLKKLVFCE